MGIKHIRVIRKGRRAYCGGVFEQADFFPYSSINVAEACEGCIVGMWSRFHV